MADDFKLDLDSIKAWGQEAELIKNTMGGTKKYAQDIDRILQDVAKANTELTAQGKLLGVDAELIKDMQEIYGILLSMGIPATKILAYREKESKIFGDLIKVQKDLLQGEKKRADNLKDMGKTSEGVLSSFSQKGKEVAGYFSGMGKVNLTLIGIIAKIVDLYNKANRISGFAEQSARQWGAFKRTTRDTGALLKDNTDLTYQMTSAFKMTLDESKDYVRSLAMSGIEQDQMFFRGRQLNVQASKRVNIASEMLAIQALQNRSVAEQMPYVQGLIANFGKTAHEANRFGYIVADITKDIPGLTMEEALQDVTSMADQTKIFNMTLLDTLSLYNTIIRKSEIWGETISAAPRVVQKEIAKTITGWGLSLEPGMKIALGAAMGIKGTPAEQLLGFEEEFSKNMGSAVKAMSKVVTDWTSQLGGADKIVAIRRLLQQRFGFQSKEAAMTMAKAFGKGEMTPERIEALVQELAKNKEAAKKAAETYEKNLKLLVANGAKLAGKLITLEQKIANWIDLKFIGPVMSLVGAIKDLTSTIKNSWLMSGFTQAGEVYEAGTEALASKKKAIGTALGMKRGLKAAGLGAQTLAPLQEAGIKQQVWNLMKTQQYKQELLSGPFGQMPLTKELRQSKRGQAGWAAARDIGGLAAISGLDANEILLLIDLLAENKKDEAIALLNQQFTEEGVVQAITTVHQTGFVNIKKRPNLPAKGAPRGPRPEI